MVSERRIGFAALLVAAGTTVWASQDPDIPSREPADAIMAGPAEVQAAADWAVMAFGGEVPRKDDRSARVELRRQDHSVLRYGQSCMETPVHIGGKTFQHGLGTHANSEILVKLPPGARRLQAAVGIDNNFNTQGQRGTVQFSVEIAGREVFRTPTLKGGGEPTPVDATIPPGTREIVLKVDATPDGAAHDQADWADARVVLEDGTAVWLDAGTQTFLEPRLPFSFQYGGAPSGDLLKSWKRLAQPLRDAEDRTGQEINWTDPKTGLKLTAEVSAFKKYPAVEWVLYFENTGQSDTPVLENIQALDAIARTGYSRNPATLHQIVGDVRSERSFLPFDTVLEGDKSVTFAPTGGRSSNGTFPFFNLEYVNEGAIVAVGWSGQWSATLRRAGMGPTRVQAGMEKTRLVLHPGERIRSPRMLVMTWKGDRLAAQQRFRRLMLFHYVPKQAGRPLQLPIAGQCFDRYYGSRPKWGSEAEQIPVAKATARAGCDTHWLDAAWFEKGFPNGVGNWSPRPDGFPNGMKSLADVVHGLGMKFMVWFEPERVAAGSQIAREHPEFVFGGEKGGLFKLNDPAARRFLTELLSRRIGEFGLDIYRNDFNIDPLDTWRRNDAPDRQGMTEIRYIEGLYAMWDQLLADHPGLWIDNCASGGRRIDLEMCMRSIPLWHSDTGCSQGPADWNQSHTMGLSQYLPLFEACAWTPDAYEMRSAMTAGIVCDFDLLNEKFPFEKAKEAIAEVEACRKYWYGDFYPLMRANTSPDHWMAYQFHRADLDAGMALVFRRTESPYPVLALSLRVLRPEGKYAVEFIDDARKVEAKTLTGRELMSDTELRIAKRPGSMLIRYAPTER